MNPTMRAVRIVEPGQIAVVEVERPRTAACGVLLRMLRVGYCGTDLSTYLGKNPLVNYPRIPGHELAGEIVELGHEVDGDWRLGERVLVLPYTSCGACPSCRQGRFNACRSNQTLGVQRDGGLAEYLAVPAEKLLRAPGLEDHERALVEPLTVGFHAADRGRVANGDRVLVFGCGAIGLGAISGAAARGATVFAVDLDPTKLETARAAGASVGIHGGEGDLAATVAKLTDGDGPDVVIEAVGLPQTFRTAVELVAFAGRVVYIGYAKAPVEYDSKYFVQKELDILGSRNATPADFMAVITMLESGRFPVDRMLSRTVNLSEAPAAMRDWAENPQAFTKIQVTLEPLALRSLPAGDVEM